MASSLPRDGKCSDACICWVASRFFSLWPIREAPKSYILPSYSEEIEESESRSVMSNSLQPHTIVHGILQARILEWVAFPFFRGSSQPRGWTQFSHVAGRFFTSWANGREAQWQTFFSFSNPALSQWHLVPPELSESESCSVVSHSLRPHGLCSTWNPPGPNTGASSLSLL